MIKLLYVIDNIEFGGGERGFLQLASALRNRFDISFAAMPGGRLGSELTELGIKLHPVDMSKRFSLQPILQISKIIRSGRIDVVHSQGARADFFSRVAGIFAPGTPVISTIQMPVEGFDVGRLRKTIYRALDHLSDHFVERFIVVSDSLRATLIEGRGILPQRVARIYNGIELDQYRPDLQETSLRDTWTIPPSAPLVGAIGRMVWQKGFEFLIHAVPQIIREKNETRFLFVGDGPLKSHLERLVHELAISDRVMFTGFLPDIDRVLSALDILVVPSLLEGFPMICLEAMAMAKPTVATRIQGITEQISDGEDGILVPPRNSDALADAVLRLLLNEELASMLGRSARKKVETSFSLDRMIEETKKVYLSVLKN